MFKKMSIILSTIFIVFIVISIAGCKTIESEIKEEQKPIVKEDKEDKEETPKITIKEFGADREVLSVKIGNKTYYVLGKNNTKNINEENIKNINLVAPLKISEETVKGFNGIVITYYDIKIFLGEKGSSVKVGLFEPQKNSWTIGDDIDRSQSIQIKLADNGVGLITIGRSSISLSYR